jgi:CheY-like chemotaxis protein
MAQFGSVLIVDDSERCIEFLALSLQSEGISNITSETMPIVAVDRIGKERPDLILLDIKMPELDGFGLLAYIRGAGIFTPVLVVSGSARQADIDRAYALGCNGYFEKPAALEGYRTIASAIASYWQRSNLPSSEMRPLH